LDHPGTAHLLPPTTAPGAAIGPVERIALRLDELAGAQDPAPMASRARPGDLPVVISSGGTTGVPKGSVRDFAAYTVMVAAPSPRTRRQLANGKLACLTPGPGRHHPARRRHGRPASFQPADTLAAIESERVTHLFLVEPQLFEVMDHPDVTRRDLSSLSVLTHIGAAAAPVLRMRARDRIGPVIAHTYGASEMGIVSALTPPEHDLAHPERFACTGQIVPGVEVRFRSPDGTLGELDEEGYLHIHGRVVDCAEVDGRLVTPVALQDLLCRRPDVRYAVIVLDPDAGTRVVAAVPWPGQAVDAAGCLDAIDGAFGPLVASTVVVLPVDRIPLTEQGKPNRPEIRRLARERTARA